MRQKFEMIEALPPYVFEQIRHIAQKSKEKGMQILDFSMGNPDLAPPAHVVNKLIELTSNTSLYGYSTVGGITELRDALAKYYARRFGVDLDPKSEVLVTIGSKEGQASLAKAICQNGDLIAVPNPCYPIHTFGFTMSSANVIHFDAPTGEEFFSHFKKYVESIYSTGAKKPFAVVINFPSNPTTQIVDLGFFERVVEFCIKHQIYIISDIAYSEIYFDDNQKPHSIFEVKNAKEIAIEFSTISKSFSMPGARVGFAAGNKTLINALYKIKSYLDYSTFTPIQLAVCDALSEKSDPYLFDLRKRYKTRAEALCKNLRGKLDIEFSDPKATMFLWSKIPDNFSHLSSLEFCKKLIEEKGVVLSPGTGFGSKGEGFIRFSLIHDEENISKAVDLISSMKA